MSLDYLPAHFEQMIDERVKKDCIITNPHYKTIAVYYKGQRVMVNYKWHFNNVQTAKSAVSRHFSFLISKLWHEALTDGFKDAKESDIRKEIHKLFEFREIG